MDLAKWTSRGNLKREMDLGETGLPGNRAVREGPARPGRAGKVLGQVLRGRKRPGRFRGSRGKAGFGESMPSVRVPGAGRAASGFRAERGARSSAEFRHPGLGTLRDGMPGPGWYARGGARGAARHVQGPRLSTWRLFPCRFSEFRTLHPSSFRSPFFRLRSSRPGARAPCAGRGPAHAGGSERCAGAVALPAGPMRGGFRAAARPGFRGGGARHRGTASGKCLERRRRPGKTGAGKDERGPPACANEPRRQFMHNRVHAPVPSPYSARKMGSTTCCIKSEMPRGLIR